MPSWWKSVGWSSDGWFLQRPGTKILFRLLKSTEARYTSADASCCISRWAIPACYWPDSIDTYLNNAQHILGQPISTIQLSLVVTLLLLARHQRLIYVFGFEPSTVELWKLVPGNLTLQSPIEYAKSLNGYSSSPKLFSSFVVSVSYMHRLSSALDSNGSRLNTFSLPFI